MKTILAGLILLAPSAVAGKAGVDPGVHRSAGKQVAPVELMQPQRYEARVGEQVSMDLGLRLARPADAVWVEISADPALRLDGQPRRRDLGGRDAGMLGLPPLRATVLEEGRHHVNVTVFMRGQWGQRFRSFSVTVATPAAGKAAGPRADLKQGAKGEVLRVMPAVQSD